MKLTQFFGSKVEGLPAVGILLARLVFGYAMLQHGLPKMANPAGWMGPDSPIPGFFQTLATFSEVGGGIALMIGLLTPLGALGIFFTMVVAVQQLMNRGLPFIAPPGQPSWEMATLFGAFSLLIVLTGGGRYSLDALIFGPKKVSSSPAP